MKPPTLRKETSLNLDSCIADLYFGGMNIRITPEQEARLADLASRTGKAADEIIQEALTRLLDEDARFVEAVKLGEAALERGEYLTHEQVGERLERLFRS